MLFCKKVDIVIDTKPNFHRLFYRGTFSPHRTVHTNVITILIYIKFLVKSLFSAPKGELIHRAYLPIIIYYFVNLVKFGSKTEGVDPPKFLDGVFDALFPKSPKT